MSANLRVQLWTAHGVLGNVSWGFIFPLGAILIRIVPSRIAWLVHAFVMLFGLIAFTANVAIGLSQTLSHGYKVSAVHTILGVIIFALAWTQPISGLVHHYILKNHDKKTISSTLHLFFGRVLIGLGAINGGLGLLMAHESTAEQNIAYGTIVGIIYIAYLIASLWLEAGRYNLARKALEHEHKVVPFQEGFTQQRVVSNGGPDGSASSFDKEKLG